MAAPKIILPEKGKNNILITSALPYVNNVPHLGNVVGSVLSADVYSRFSKLRDRPTLYICGTDEYGTATETKALETGQTPKELCDEFHKKHKDVYDWFEIGFDYFGRTTTEQQTVIAQDIFLKLHKNGFLEERTTTQPYCEKHESFLADRFVEGTCPKCQYDDARGDQCDKCGSLLDPFELINPHCKVDGATPVPRETTHIFLRLDKVQGDIEKWFDVSSVEGAWPQNGVSITRSWLKQGLEGRSITRDLKWGTPIPLPGYEKKVLYVWFDACIGYPSITANYTKDWELWWRDPENVKLYQFMGKDNVPFHTVIFPGSQIGTNDKWTMLNHLSTTEYLNYENGKFSKSRGVGVFGDTVKETGIPPSVWRYYLLANRPETGDTQFEWKSFIAANNSELLANLGNFVNRLIKFVNAKLDGTIPEFQASYSDDSFDFPNFIEEVNSLLAEYVADMEAVRLRAGLQKVMQISQKGNLILAGRLDNANLKESPERTKSIIGLALNLAYLLASISSPYMPSTAASIVKQLNAPLISITDKWTPDSLAGGHKIGKAEYLFTKIDDKKEEEWRLKYGGTQATRLAEEEAKVKKAADKLRDKERKKAKKEAELAKKAAAETGESSKSAEDKKVGAKVEAGTGQNSQVELPLRGAVPEEQAPPPSAAP
ncbi:Nucleotidylyl transferase [Glarea lozoyensis ATCC 20868]|uniref:methionine--tRNA ligase n=2 Tax=Glarea lozoyensis TaxID=101852 RepID=S3CWM5_GLAL2|nr:Nucleotidylyl transferase [Glarea lozoyensis ATCC 20868]EPE29334.1 Nucleotidylyl transferase [Glarea lozoyensis ATCC 20868]